MKKTITIISFASISILYSFNAQAFMDSLMTTCMEDEEIRKEITIEEQEDENSPFFHQNPFSMEGCDLGFDMPGFSFDFDFTGGLDLCSLAKDVTEDARDSWNDTVKDAEEWTKQEVDVDLEDGVTVNGDKISDGVGDNSWTSSDEGGSYSTGYTPKFDENGMPYYESY